MRISSLQFDYDPEYPVLCELNFVLRRGGVVAVVGASGAGKSALINLIRRFWDPDQGNIRVLDIDIRDLAGADLRHHTAIVEQDVQALAGSLCDNLTLDRPGAAPEVITTAVEDAQLDALVVELPVGLDSPVGGREIGLSGGEVAWLTLTRVLVMGLNLLMPDEATANLDVSIGLGLYHVPAHAVAGWATLTVARRRSTTGRADRVIVLEDGQIITDITPDGLTASDTRWNASSDRAQQVYPGKDEVLGGNGPGRSR